jgi:hypothetical protein
MGHANRHHQADQRPGGHRKQRNQRGVIARAKHPTCHDGRLLNSSTPITVTTGIASAG